MNKTYMASGIAAAVVVVAWVIAWTMSSSVANDDYTCYNYSMVQGSCQINEANCGAWENGKRVCNGTRIDTYSRGSSYRCGTFGGEDRERYTVNAACSVEQTDTVSPEVIEGWVE